MKAWDESVLCLTHDAIAIAGFCLGHTAVVVRHLPSPTT